jgi:hypothetical protein
VIGPTVRIQAVPVQYLGAVALPAQIRHSQRGTRCGGHAKNQDREERVEGRH